MDSRHAAIMPEVEDSLTPAEHDDHDSEMDARHAAIMPDADDSQAPEPSEEGDHKSCENSDTCKLEACDGNTCKQTEAQDPTSDEV